MLLRRLWDTTIGRLLRAILVGLIRGYQRFISPLTPPSCRYHPSCSSYALTAVRVHGPVKGFILASWRLLRCNPWSRGGIDFPPPRGGWRGDDQVRPTIVAHCEGCPDPIDARQSAQVAANSRHKQ